MEKTEKRNEIKCKDCKKNFRQFKSYISHYCPGTGPFTCEICCQSFEQYPLLSNHILQHVKKSVSKYICDICGNSFTNTVNLKKHISLAHKGSTHRCSGCEKKFITAKKLERHQCKKCFECDILFSTKSVYVKHMEMHANFSMLYFKCKYCSTTFMKKSTLNSHESKLDCSRAARNYWLEQYNATKCRICGISLPNEEGMIFHFQSVHDGLKAHQCFWCECQLSTIDELKEHVNYHNTYRFSCNLCDKQYISHEGYRRHRIKHKPDDIKCKYCDAVFLRYSRYLKHIANCKKDPALGYVSKTKSERDEKQSRQLNWESRIVIKRVRGEEMKERNFEDVDEVEDDLSDRPGGWFDDYYKANEEGDSLRDFDGDLDNVELPAVVSPNISIDNSEPSSCDEVADDCDVDFGYNPKLCRICDTNFSLEYELLHHFIKTHPRELPHKCPKCDEGAPLFAQLKEHLKEHGIGLGIHHCGNCSKKFRSENSLKLHYIKCIGDVEGKALIDTCRRCGKTYQTKSGFKGHKLICKGFKRLKEDNSHVKIEKEDSGIDYRSMELWEINDFHVNETLKEDESPAEEYVCSPIALNNNPPQVPISSELQENVKVKVLVEPPKDSFPCRLCSAKFQFERGIVMHFKAEHPTEKPLICHVCGIALADKMKEHLKTHGIGEEFVCKLCGKHFNQKFLGKIHELWHQGIEYKCDYCRQKFLSEEKRDKHVKEGRCKLRVSLMLLPCSVCGKFFKSKFGLNSHYKTHTPKELRPAECKMNCEFCGKWFDSNNGLQRHRRIHTGEKPYCCRFCPRAFAQESNCKAHERTHTGEANPRKKKKLAAPVEPANCPSSACF